MTCRQNIFLAVFTAIAAACGSISAVTFITASALRPEPDRYGGVCLIPDAFG